MSSSVWLEHSVRGRAGGGQQEPGLQGGLGLLEFGSYTGRGSGIHFTGEPWRLRPREGKGLPHLCNPVLSLLCCISLSPWTTQRPCPKDKLVQGPQATLGDGGHKKL